MPDTEHGIQEQLFQNIPLNIFNNFKYDQLVLKIKFKDLKRQLSSQITEKYLNEISKWRHMAETGHSMQK